MQFYIEASLAAQMRKKNRPVLAVECAVSSTSDIEIAEIYLRLVTRKFADYLRERKRYRLYPVQDLPDLQVAVCPYQLQYEAKVTFRRKKTGRFSRRAWDGIRV